MEYYIRETETPDGPYDLMALIRKVRNGSITPATPVSIGIFEAPAPAGELQELKPFFEDSDEDEEGSNHYIRRSHRFGGLLGIGADFLKQNHYVAVFSGLFMILWLILAMAFIFEKSLLMTVIGIGLSYFLMGGYMFGVLRYLRGHPVSASIVVGRMAQTAINMAVVSFIFAMTLLPGLLIVYTLGMSMLYISLPVLLIFLLLVLTLLAFAPLLVTDKSCDFWDSVMSSLRVVTANRGQHLGNVFGLMALNFLLLPLMPIIFPITMGGIAELYEEHFG